MIKNGKVPIFHIKDFEVVYPNSNKKIVYNVDFPIFQNEIILITGRSGSGKSTLFLVLKGILSKIYNCRISGKIYFENNNIIDNYPEFLDIKIGYLGQNPYSQIMNSIVIDELVFGMENYKYPKEIINKNIIKYSNIFKLEEKLEEKTKSLSGGLCQRLNLASIISYEPPILLLDEPVSFLDNNAIKIFYEILKSFKGKKTIFIIEHNFKDILPVVDKVMFFENDYEDLNYKSKIISSFTDKEFKICKVKNINLDNKEIENKSLIENQNKIFLQMTNNEKANKNNGKEKFKKLSISFSAKDINFKYNNFKIIFEKLSFDYKGGEIIGIIGENGSGKTTLLQLMAGIIKPLKGSIELIYDSKRIKKIYKLISILFQNSESLFFFPLIKDEIFFQMKKDKINIEKIKDLFEHDFFPFLNYMEKSGFMLSEGEKKRLGFIISVLMNKPIKLYDEPTYAQDYAKIEIIKKFIKKFKEEGNLQIIVSHDFDFLNSISDKIYLIKDKKLVKL